jgi:hypothetical protein
LALCSSDFDLHFAGLNNKSVTVTASLQLKPARVETISGRQITKGPWILVDLAGKSTDLSESPGSRINAKILKYLLSPGYGMHAKCFKIFTQSTFQNEC